MILAPLNYSLIRERGMDNKIPLIKMENIHKWFGKIYALKNIDFEVYSGEIVGLIGENGAGKSTLIKILSGVLRQDRGDIYFNSKNIGCLTVKKAREIGIETVFQEQALIDCFDVGRNIFLTREPVRKIGFLKLINYKKMYSQAKIPLELLGLKLSPRQEVQYCSGGERQGVAIARAMEFKAKLVILDEPTRNLSVQGVLQVKEFIRKLKESGISVIFITHDIHHIFSLADKFVVIARGEKVLEINKKDTTVEKIESYLVKLSSGQKKAKL